MLLCPKLEQWWGRGENDRTGKKGGGGVKKKSVGKEETGSVEFCGVEVHAPATGEGGMDNIENEKKPTEWGREKKE